MAPEVINHEELYKSGRATDIWSLGCVVIQMMTGMPDISLIKLIATDHNNTNCIDINYTYAIPCSTMTTVYNTIETSCN